MSQLTYLQKLQRPPANDKLDRGKVALNYHHAEVIKARESEKNREDYTKRWGKNRII